MIIPFGFLKRAGNAATDFLTNLVAWWEFEGDYTDSIGTNDGTPFGGTSVVNSGIVGTALDLAGVNDYVTIPAASDVSFIGVDFTFSFWFNFDVVDQTFFIEKRSDLATAREYAIYYFGGLLAFQCFSETNSPDNRIRIEWTPSPALTNSQWYHFAGTVKHSTLEILMYVDGVSVGTRNDVGTYTGMTATVSPVTFGMIGWGINYELNGRMDEVKFWKGRALTSSEILEVYNTELAGTRLFPYNYSESLVASWQFEDDFSDYTGNHDGTASASPPTFVTDGAVGKSANFGTEQWIETPNSSDFSFTDGFTDLPCSIAFWMKIDSFTGTQFIIWKGGGATGKEWRVTMGLDFQLILFHPTSGTDTIRVGVPVTGLSINTWYHVVFTYTGSQSDTGMKMYLDGVDVGIGFSEGTYPAMTADTGGLSIADRIDIAPSTNDFDGRLNEIKIYKNRVLTVGEVLNMYNEELAGNSVLP
tara:strand:- start:70 stop:1488 length:1419 start_codon:yes stop_codon:yes gene_type:complete